MMDKGRKNTVDIAIIGGGIAGLWTLARLQQSGYQAVLLEAQALGCVQSGASQGIIHGGTKYALTGKLTHSSQAIQQMPQRWKDCLEGRGEVDLTKARKLSDHQYLWSNKNLTSRLTGFFASKVMSSRMQHLSVQDYVPPFNRSAFHGNLYQLDEPVLDIHSVIEAIREQFQPFILHMAVDEINSDASSSNYQIKSSDKSHTLNAKTLIFAAGAGNEKLLSHANLQQPQLQLRPLLMPMLKANESVLPKMYAHCLGASALPKMTITAHQLASEVVWYLGGEIAETGVGRSNDEQVQAAKEELQTLMPWMDFSQCQWSTLAIDRAEPKMQDGSRPSEPAVFRDKSRRNNIITAWPVKLAMAPIMVDKIVLELEQLGIEKNSRAIDLTDIPLAQTSPLPWDKVQNWL